MYIYILQARDRLKKTLQLQLYTVLLPVNKIVLSSMCYDENQNGTSRRVSLNKTQTSRAKL